MIALVGIRHAPTPPPTAGHLIPHLLCVLQFLKGAMNQGGGGGGGSSELGGLGQLSQVFGHAESQSGSGAGASDIMSAYDIDFCTLADSLKPL